MGVREAQVLAQILARVLAAVYTVILRMTAIATVITWQLVVGGMLCKSARVASLNFLLIR